MSKANEIKGRPVALSPSFPDLPFGEQLLVWALRVWVQGLKQDQDSAPLLKRGFKLAGMPDAHHAFNDFMAIVSASAQAKIDIRCTACSDISLDEHRFLATVAVLQDSRPSEEADRILAAWMPERARRYAIGPARVIAHELRRKSLGVRPRPWLLEVPGRSWLHWHQGLSEAIH